MVNRRHHRPHLCVALIFQTQNQLWSVKCIANATVGFTIHRPTIQCGRMPLKVQSSRMTMVWCTYLIWILYINWIIFFNLIISFLYSCLTWRGSILLWVLASAYTRFHFLPSGPLSSPPPTQGQLWLEPMWHIPTSIFVVAEFKYAGSFVLNLKQKKFLNFCLPKQKKFEKFLDHIFYRKIVIIFEDMPPVKRGKEFKFEFFWFNTKESECFGLHRRQKLLGTTSS